MKIASHIFGIEKTQEASTAGLWRFMENKIPSFLFRNIIVFVSYPYFYCFFVIFPQAFPTIKNAFNFYVDEQDTADVIKIPKIF